MAPGDAERDARARASLTIGSCYSQLVVHRSSILFALILAVGPAFGADLRPLTGRAKSSTATRSTLRHQRAARAYVSTRSTRPRRSRRAETPTIAATPAVPRRRRSG